MEQETNYITVNLLHVWLGIKTAAAFGLWRYENKAWPGRALHQRLRRGIFHLAVNPELAVFKMAAFLPVWLLTGKRFWRTFSPIKSYGPNPSVSAGGKSFSTHLHGRRSSAGDPPKREGNCQYQPVQAQCQKCNDTGLIPTSAALRLYCTCKVGKERDPAYSHGLTPIPQSYRNTLE